MKKEKYPYRFKTKKEFTEEYGDEWWTEIDWNNPFMNPLMGTVLKKTGTVQNMGNSSATVCRLYSGGREWNIYECMLTENKPKVPTYEPKKFVY